MKNSPALGSILDLRQTPEYVRYMESLGWRVIRLGSGAENTGYAYLRSVPLLGNIVKIQRLQTPLNSEDVKSLMSQRGLAAIYYEPSINHPVPPGFVFASSCFLPPKTIQVDLVKSEGSLLSQMKPKTRYNIGVAKRKVVVHESSDIAMFSKMWQKSARNRGMWLSQEKEIRALHCAFAQKSGLLFAYMGKELVGGVFIVYTPDCSYYMYAWSSPEGKRSFAPTLLAWEGILSARARGPLFDFEGVYDSRYLQTMTWKGFTRFKEGFGGAEVLYPRALVYYQNPILKLLRV